MVIRLKIYKRTKKEGDATSKHLNMCLYIISKGINQSDRLLAMSNNKNS